MLCLISMIHSMMLFLCLQCCRLLKKKKKKRNDMSKLLMDVLCILFLLSSPLRSSSMSVVFDFNDSLNDDAPLYPIPFPVGVNRKKKSELLMDVFCVSSLFCLHHPDRALLVLCLISMLHSMMLLLCILCCWLCMREMKRVIC